MTLNCAKDDDGTSGGLTPRIRRRALLTQALLVHSLLIHALRIHAPRFLPRA